VRVSILLTCGQHLHYLIISPGIGNLGHETN
jgi:hypothetical protein